MSVAKTAIADFAQVPMAVHRSTAAAPAASVEVGCLLKVLWSASKALERTRHATVDSTARTIVWPARANDALRLYRHRDVTFE